MGEVDYYIRNVNGTSRSVLNQDSTVTIPHGDLHSPHSADKVTHRKETDGNSAQTENRRMYDAFVVKRMADEGHVNENFVEDIEESLSQKF